MKSCLLRLEVALLVGFGLAVPVSHAAQQRRGPFLLVALPSLGAVTWSCGGVRNRDVSLGFRVYPADATTTVTFVASAMTRKLTLQPGQSTRFPLRSPGKQELRIAQGTEARTLRATVVATFSRRQSYCFSYFPPGISVTVWQVHR